MLLLMRRRESWDVCGGGTVEKKVMYFWTLVIWDSVDSDLILGLKVDFFFPSGQVPPVHDMKTRNNWYRSVTLLGPSSGEERALSRS